MGIAIVSVARSRCRGTIIALPPPEADTDDADDKRAYPAYDTSDDRSGM